jgi:hypothetical protein
LAIERDKHLSAKEKRHAPIEGPWIGAAKIVERGVAGRKELIGIGDADPSFKSTPW